MKEKDDSGTIVPYSKTTITTSLAFVMAVGGYSGYYVSQESPSKRIIGNGFDDVTHEVTDVIDADTFVIDDTHRVRMIGINAPEKDQCFYSESKNFLTKLLLGREVILQKDSKTTDDFGRLLRYVFVYDSDGSKDNVFVNNLLVQEGYAVSDFSGANRKYEKLLSVSLGAARSNDVGLHEACEPLVEPELIPINEQCVIKGNQNSDNDNRIYYVPGCPNYDVIKMRASEGDKYFCSETEATEEGYRIAGNCPK